MKLAGVITLLVMTGLSLSVPAQESGHASHAQHTGHAAHGRKTIAWSRFPLLVKSGPRSRVRIQFSPQHLESNKLVIFPSTGTNDTGKSWQIEVIDNKSTLITRGSGNYHWIQAREEKPDSLRLASTVQYFSNPGPAPSSMLTVSKSELEIRPLKLPREHRHYRANEKWPFQLLYLGKPLADTSVQFQTQHGSHQQLRTDSGGQFHVLFPDDFPQGNVTAHSGHGRHSAAFVLAAEHHENNRQILSAFNYHYTPGAYANKSLWLGVVFMVLGMVVASPLLVRRDKSTEENAI